MSHRMHSSNRIVIVGGGISGLSIAVRLAQAGLPVTVLEASRLGMGASTRNQGWLYSGAWFAPEQPELARMCYESHQQTLGFCPECLEPNSGRMVYLITDAQTDRNRWTSAWEATEIPYDNLTPAVSVRFSQGVLLSFSAALSSFGFLAGSGLAGFFETVSQDVFGVGGGPVVGE